MVNPEKHRSMDGGRGNDVDRSDQVSSGGDSSSSSSIGHETTIADQSISRRLRDIFSGDEDADLLMQRNDKEDDFLQWLRALDMQAMGACRADERLKPLLKLNISAAADEDGLLSQLSQHFEPPEVCMLARGNLCLTLLPNSDLRISFIGDNAAVERLVTIGSESDDIEIQGLSADSSGRSFLIRFSDTVSYYWCSEKSKLLGDELLRKMKNLLEKKPSLAELTRISKSRIDCFGTQIRSYLVDSAVGITSDDTPDRRHIPESSLNCQKSSLRLRQFGGNQVSKSNLITSLSPRPSSFKENYHQKSLGVSKFRHRYVSSSDVTSSTSFQKDKLGEVSGSKAFTVALDCLEILNKSTEFPLPTTSESKTTDSPHYCWCPPLASAEPLALPPLSSFPSSLSLFTSKPLLNFVPPLDFPTIMPKPLVNLPLSASQQIPKFTPLMSDPIVHIPMISVGPGYLVSAGPSLTATLADPKSESMVEKGARETLRMLISASSQPKPQQLLEMLRSTACDVTAGSRGVDAALSEMRLVDDIFQTDDLVEKGIENASGYDLCEADDQMD